MQHPVVVGGQDGVSLRITAASDDVDAAELELLALQLRADLLASGVSAVDRESEGPAPEGTRAVELIVAGIGFLVTGLSTAAAVAQVADFVQRWRQDHPRRSRIDVQVVPGGGASVPPRTGRRSALLVANGAYRDPGLSRLRSPVSDIRALAQVLGDRAIGGFEVDTLIDADEAAVRRRVARFFADRSPDDVLLLHFSCHGIKDQRGRLFLAAADTELSSPAATGLAAAYVSERMSESASRSVLLILDCCYSGAFARDVRADRTVHVADEFRAGGTGLTVLTASSATEYSFEGGQVTAYEAAPSVFTQALVGGLRTGAADLDHDGDISADELFEYAAQQLRETRAGQAPRKWTFDVTGRLVVARSVRPAELPELIRADLVSDRPVLRVEAVTALAALLTGSREGFRRAAREALIRLRDNDDSGRVRTAAAAALAEEGPPRPASPPRLTDPEPPAPVPADSTRRPTRPAEAPLADALLAAPAPAEAPLADALLAAPAPAAGLARGADSVKAPTEEALPATAPGGVEVLGEPVATVGSQPEPLTPKPGSQPAESTRPAETAPVETAPVETAPVETPPMAVPAPAVGLARDADSVQAWEVDAVPVAAYEPAKAPGKPAAAPGPQAVLGRVAAPVPVGGRRRVPWVPIAAGVAVAMAVAFLVVKPLLDDDGGGSSSARQATFGTSLGYTTISDPGTVEWAVLSADAKWVATVDSGSRLHHATVWETAHGAKATEFDVIGAVVFSPDGSLVASATTATGSVNDAGVVVELRKTATGEKVATFSGHKGSAAIAFSPDGRMVATASTMAATDDFDAPVRLWNTADGKLLKTLSGHTNGIQDMEFSPDGAAVVSGAAGGVLKIWDVASGKATATLENTWFPLWLAGDGASLANGYPGEYQLRSMPKGTLVATVTDTGTFLGFSADGKAYATDKDGTVRRWETATRKLLTTLDGRDLEHVTPSPDGKLIAAATKDGTVRLWDTATGQVVATMSGHTGKVMAIVFTHDARLLTAGTDKTVRRWYVGA